VTGTLEAARLAALARIADEEGRLAQYGDEYMAIAAGEFPHNANGYAYVAALTVKAGDGTLYGFSGYSSGGVATFVLAFDLGDAGQLASASVPEFIVPVSATSGFSYDGGFHGRRFLRGIVLASSSTPTVYTATAAICWFDAQYV
jgi:hypothetical protein